MGKGKWEGVLTLAPHFCDALVMFGIIYLGVNLIHFLFSFEKVKYNIQFLVDIVKYVSQPQFSEFCLLPGEEGGGEERLDRSFSHHV